jgi:hypothetical protein
VQLGEELDAILERKQLIHYTAEMITTKAREKKEGTFFFKWSKKWSKESKKLLKSCQKIVKKLVKILKQSDEEDDRD